MTYNADLQSDYRFSVNGQMGAHPCLATVPVTCRCLRARAFPHVSRVPLRLCSKKRAAKAAMLPNYHFCQFLFCPARAALCATVSLLSACVSLQISYDSRFAKWRVLTRFETMSSSGGKRVSDKGWLLLVERDCGSRRATSCCLALFV